MRKGRALCVPAGSSALIDSVVPLKWAMPPVRKPLKYMPSWSQWTFQAAVTNPGFADLGSPPLSTSSEEADDMMRRLLAMLTEWEVAVL